MPSQTMPQRARMRESGRADIVLPELQAIRPYLSPAYQALPDAVLWRALNEQLAEQLSEEEIESVWNTVGNVLAGAGSGAATGAAFGPWGALIGAGIGAATSGVQAANRPRTPAAARPRTQRPASPLARPVPQPAAQQPAQPSAPPVAASPSPPVEPVTPSPAAPSPGTPAVTAPQPGALSTLVSPHVLQTLAQAILPLLLQHALPSTPGAGPSSDQRAHALHMLNAYRHLLDRAYLDALLHEPSSDVRDAVTLGGATSVHDLLEEARALGAHALAQAGEAIVEPLAGSLANLARFRAGVANTSVFPFSAICQLRMKFGSSWFLGTGFYVARDRILTAGHNVFDSSDGWASEVIVTPGRQSLMTQPFPSFTVRRDALEAHPNWQREPRGASFDLAVLKVRTPPPNGQAFDAQPLRSAPSSSIAVCGYAAETQHGVDPNRQSMDVDRVRELLAESFTYSLHTTKGTSGSPVFTTGSDGRVTAIGVHSRANDRHTNRACRLTPDKLSWLAGIRDEGMPREREPAALHDPQDLHLFDERHGVMPRGQAGAAGRRRIDLRGPMSIDSAEALRALDELGVFGAADDGAARRGEVLR